MLLNRMLFAGLLAGGLVCAGPLAAQSSTDTGTKTDNTKVNKRDRAAGAVTADQQKMNEPDRKLTQQIRKAVMADKSLSTYAHNVKIVTEHGAVTLKGPVRSEEEKKAVMAKATEVVGAGKVTDEMTVEPKNK